MRTAVGRWYTREGADGPRVSAAQVPGARWLGASRRAAARAPEGAVGRARRCSSASPTKGWEGGRRLERAAHRRRSARIEAVQAMRADVAGRCGARDPRLSADARDGADRAARRTPWCGRRCSSGCRSRALVRNLGVMSKVGLLVPGTRRGAHGRRRGWAIARRFASRARAPARGAGGAQDVRAGARHDGEGQRGRRCAQVVDALDGAFYLSFENAPSTGKRIMLALDVSGSMVRAGARDAVPVVPRGVGGDGAGDGGDGAESSVRRVHERRRIRRCSRRRTVAYDTGLTPLAISPRQRLDDVVKLDSELAVRRHGLRAADGRGAEAPLGGGRVRRLHGQRDVGRQHSSGAGAPRVSGADGHRREAGGGRR